MQVVHKSKEQRFTLGVCYAPDVVDSQGDWASPQTIEKAAHNFMQHLKTGDNGLNLEHDDTGEIIGEIVESYIAPADIIIGSEVIKAGTWLTGIVWTEKHWKTIKDDTKIGLSIEGRGRRK